MLEPSREKGLLGPGRSEGLELPFEHEAGLTPPAVPVPYGKAVGDQPWLSALLLPEAALV